MDWRLGLDLLRVLADPEEVLLGDEEDDLSARIAGLDAHDNRRDLLEHYQRLAHRLVAAGGQGFTTSTFAGLPGVIDATNEVAYIVVHPLWSLGENTGEMAPVVEEAWMAAVEEGFEEKKIRFVDAFNVERRPSWSLHGLVN